MDKKKRKPGPTAQRAAMEDAVTLREQGRGDIRNPYTRTAVCTAVLCFSQRPHPHRET